MNLNDVKEHLMLDLPERLARFTIANRFSGKSPLSVALVITRAAKTKAFPLNPSDFITESKGQVAGLGRASVQNILADHGITRILAQEGGRTSRGAIGKMHEYVEFLNALHTEGLCCLETIEEWWIEQVHLYFASEPLRQTLPNGADFPIKNGSIACAAWLKNITALLKPMKPIPT